MGDEFPPVERIVVAIDSAAALAGLLDAATGLALGLHAELACLFVEDEQLVRLAELPFARELGFTSARLRPFSQSDLNRALRLQAEQVRALLDSTAKHLSLAWNLEIVRGHLLEAALASASESDLLVLGRSRYHTGGAAPRAATPRRFASLAYRPVAVLYDGSEASLRALFYGHALARESSCRLLAIIPAQTQEEFRQKRSEVAVRLESFGGATAAYLRVADAQPETVRRAARERHVAVLLWPRRDRSGAANWSLLDLLTCPVVLHG